MRLQKKDGTIVDVNPQRAKVLLAQGATVVNPQSVVERQNPVKRKASKKKAASSKSVETVKKAAKKAAKPEETLITFEEEG